MSHAAARQHRRLLARRIARMRAHLVRLRKRVPLATRALGGLEHGAMSAVAALLAWLPTQALGLHEGFWAAITAIAVVQSEFGAARTTARDQLAGAATGGAIAVGATLVPAPPLLLYAAAVVTAVLCCWLLNVASAARLAGVTATIILLVPHAGSAERIMMSRVGEVAWGLACAIAVVGASAILGRYASARRG